MLVRVNEIECGKFFCPNCPFLVFIIFYVIFFVRLSVRSCPFLVVIRVYEYGYWVIVMWCERSFGGAWYLYEVERAKRTKIFLSSCEVDKRKFSHSKDLVFKRTKRTKRTTKRTNFFCVNIVVSRVLSMKRTNGQNCIKRVCNFAEKLLTCECYC